MSTGVPGLPMAAARGSGTGAAAPPVGAGSADEVADVGEGEDAPGALFEQPTRSTPVRATGTSARGPRLTDPSSPGSVPCAT
ncbi:hypothetical protein GCM10009528_44300 [Kineococcus aurantiacus]